MAIRLVVGLGNPGEEYERTRHNVGFRLADLMVGEAGSSWRTFSKQPGAWAEAGGLVFAKPWTFMNESGRFLRAFWDYRSISPAETLVVYDEIALPLGRVRLGEKGSAGGQKGMVSILQHAGTQEVPRLRIGIGPQPERVDSSRFVLDRFSKAEEAVLADALALARGAVETARDAGLAAAMNKYNGSPS